MRRSVGGREKNHRSTDIKSVGAAKTAGEYLEQNQRSTDIKSVGAKNSCRKNKKMANNGTKESWLGVVSL